MFRFRTLLPLILVVVLGATSFAQAYGSTFSSKSRASMGRAHQVFQGPIPTGVHSVDQVRRDSVNGLLDSDTAIYVSNGSTFTSLVAEGHLRLKLVKGSTTSYKGTFTDNLGGAKQYPASGENVSATTVNGTYSIKAYNGTFRFSLGGTRRSSVPKKYGKGAIIGTILYGAHVYKSNAPLSVSLSSFTVGAWRLPVTGTLNLQTDALGYIVPFNSKAGTTSSFAYIFRGKLAQSPVSTFGRYYPPDGFGDGSLTVTLKVASHEYSINNAMEDTSKQKIIFGNAYEGSGPQVGQQSFSAH